MPSTTNERPGRARVGRAARLAVSALCLAAAWTACQGGSQPSPSPTATTTATPSGTATATPDAQASPGPGLELAGSHLVVSVAGADAQDFVQGLSSLASGDFNGDDLIDFLIGAPAADGPDNSRDDGGEAYVIFGAAEFAETVDLSAGEQDVTIIGGAAGDSLGYSVLGTDLNADGIDDIVVAAPGVTGDEDPRTDQGRAYVFFGSPTLAGTLDIAEAAEDMSITAAEGFSRTGQALASGDVNGDGTSDLILGAPFAGREAGTAPGTPRTEVGEVYIVLGAKKLPEKVRVAHDEQDFTLAGEKSFGQFGAAVASTDVNGDSIDDIIVGASQADGPRGERPTGGAAYIFYGSRRLEGRRTVADGDQDVTIWGAAERDSLGFPIVAADFNGDGLGDTAVGARLADPLGSKRQESGAVYIVFGAEDLADTVDIAQGQQDVTVFGASVGQLLPTAMAAGDLTGDGIADLVLGSSTSDREGESGQAGVVYFLPGDDALATEIDQSQGAAYLTAIGRDAGDLLGAALYSADLTGDGKEELIAMAAESDGPGNQRPDAGEVYVVEVAPP